MRNSKKFNPPLLMLLVVLTHCFCFSFLTVSANKNVNNGEQSSCIVLNDKSETPLFFDTTNFTEEEGKENAEEEELEGAETDSISKNYSFLKNINLNCSRQKASMFQDDLLELTHVVSTPPPNA